MPRMDKTTAHNLSHLSKDELLSLLITERAKVHDQSQAIDHLSKTVKQMKLLNEQYRFEILALKRYRFGQRHEHLTGEQLQLFEESLDEDIMQLEALMAQHDPQMASEVKTRRKATRKPLPEHLEREVIVHDPEEKHCTCGACLERIGEDVTEKLNIKPAQFYVQRHVRSKWVCRQCDTLIQEPMPAEVIDKGIASAELLAHILISKYADHLPLYRQQAQFQRQGVEIARSTLADWTGTCGAQLAPLVHALQDQLLAQPILHADETPLSVLQTKGAKNKRGYLWSYCTPSHSDFKAVVYDFTEGRSGQYAQDFLKDWQSAEEKRYLVCDDYGGYKALFKNDPALLEVGCWAHARRKFHDLFKANQSPIAAQALEQIQQLYALDKQSQAFTLEEKHQFRQQEIKPFLDRYHAWLTQLRAKANPSTGLAKAIDYSLKRWHSLTQFISDPRLPLDNNQVENQIRPIALGRKNWLFAGSVRAAQRAAMVMSLIQSAKLNDLDPHAYLTDVLRRLPTHPNHRINELLPTQWQPKSN